MNSRKINKLVAASYVNNCLNQKTVNEISVLLSKSDLKKYITSLKIENMKKTLIISAPINNLDLTKFKKLFPNKIIFLKNDPSLMLGVKVVDNDIIYEFTLRNTLDKIISYMEQNYD